MANTEKRLTKMANGLESGMMTGMNLKIALNGMKWDRKKGATKMTFRVYVKDCEPFYLDVETLDDLVSFASEYSLTDKITISFQTMSIIIE